MPASPVGSAGQAEAALLEFVALESASLLQAMRMAAASNEAEAQRFDTENSPAGAQMMRDSAASWHAKASRLKRLCDALPAEED